MRTEHFQAFKKDARAGLFANTPPAVYLNDIASRAIHYLSPIRSDETVTAFGLGEEGFGEYINAFMARTFPQQKALPIRNLLCIEDESSAVFVENHPELPWTLKVTTYENLRDEIGMPIDAVLSYGVLKLEGFDTLDCAYIPNEVFGAFIKGKQLDRNLGSYKGHLPQGLVDAVITATEQLAYLDKVGLITETRSMLM